MLAQQHVVGFVVVVGENCW